jgi:tRNA-guanine family transglycosylase
MDSIENREKMRNDVLFLGDSGGYQVLQNILDPTKNVKVCEKLTPEKVIEWQLKDCDIGMTLDIPTPRAWIKINNKKIFKDRLEVSKKNAQQMLKYKEDNISKAYNPNFKLLNCIHGANLEQMERWYKETTGYNKTDDKLDFEYDGFALPTGQIMKYLLALRLGFAMEYSRGKPFHLLGVSSQSALALIAYANKYTNTQITFDSTTAANGRRFRKYMVFWNLTGSGITLYGDPDKRKHEYLPLECPCPICTQLHRPEDLWELGTTSGILLTLHNLFWMTSYTAFIKIYSLKLKTAVF